MSRTFMKLSFVVHGPPVPKARARVATNAEGKTHAFTPAKTKAYEKHVGTIALATRTHHRQWPHLDKAARFGLSVRVYRSREQGDLDNFIKAALDSCNGVLWVDDSQVRRFVECSVDECEKGKERLEVDAWTLD
jgi:Holliday junction resolvase RusA-like endonuclease